MINDHGSRIGGDLTYMLNLKEALEKRNNIVKILSSDIHLGGGHFGDYEFRSFSKNSIGKALYYIFNPFSYFKLSGVLKEFKPDIVHIHNIYYQVSPSILAHLRKYPTVMTIHSYELICPNNFMHSFSEKGYHKTDFENNCCNHSGIEYYYYKFRFMVYKKLFKNVDTFIPISNFVQNTLNKSCYKTIQVIYGGIKLLEYSRISYRKNLLYIGRLSKEKGVEYILKAMPLIIKKVPSVHLNIVGDGDEKHKLESLSKELNLENIVTFIGSVPYKEVGKYYKNANIIIVPSLWLEPFGLIGPEAMSAGRPVIASRVGGIPEWLDDGKTGFLVDPGNSKQISEKAIQLLSDRKLSQQMGKNALKKSEQFSIEKHVGKIEKVYLNTIKKYK